MHSTKAVALALLAGLTTTMPALAAPPELTRETVNSAEFRGGPLPEGQSALVVRLQVLLDRAGISPGVIDGYWGENVRTAVAAFETREGLAVDGALDRDVWARLMEHATPPALAEYTVTEDDVAGPFVAEIPEDFAEMAKMERLAYTSPGELIAERFHMDRELFEQLNGGLDPAAGDTVLVARPGEPAKGPVARIEVSTSKSHVRGYDAAGELVAHYPATVGSEDLPSPSGTHEVVTVVHDPNYSYDPDKNFQQGDNEAFMMIPPGPNGPVGSVWIDLSKETYGLHGTDEPAKIGKDASHGCVRMTNWDAEALAARIEEGVPVAFVE